MDKVINNSRDTFLDSMKGICVLSIILIHTVFWSGGGYTPLLLKNLVLLLDVPTFFFLTGCLMSVKDLSPLKQMAKLMWLFFIFILIGELLTGYSSLKTILQPLMLSGSYIKPLRVVGGSYWFVPMYVVSLLYTVIITKYLHKFWQCLILFLIPSYYVYSWVTGDILNNNMLGVDSQSCLFYIWLMMLGKFTYSSKNKMTWVITLIVSISSLLLFFHFCPNLFLQKYKFPVKLPYFIGSLISISIMMLFRKSLNFKFIQFVGNKALFFYLSQGIGASILLFIAPHIDLFWVSKLLICFVINAIISISCGFIFYYVNELIIKLYSKFISLKFINKFL